MADQPSTHTHKSVCLNSLQFYDWCLHFYVCLMCVYMSMGALMCGKHTEVKGQSCWSVFYCKIPSLKSGHQVSIVSTAEASPWSSSFLSSVLCKTGHRSNGPVPVPLPFPSVLRMQQVLIWLSGRLLALYYVCPTEVGAGQCLSM